MSDCRDAVLPIVRLPRRHANSTRDLMLCALTGLLVTGPSHAGTPQWPTHLAAVERTESLLTAGSLRTIGPGNGPGSRDLRIYLAQFFERMNIPVSVDASVQGRVLAVGQNFSLQPPKTQFEKIVREHDLLPYFDGQVMHVGTQGQAQFRTFEVTRRQARRVLQVLVRRNLLDDFQSVQLLKQDGLLKIRGAGAFVRDVARILGADPRSVDRRRPLIAADVQRTPAYASRPSADQPTNTEPMIVKSFALKFASAADTIVEQNGQPVTMPGVARTLRSLLGLSSPSQPDPLASIGPSGQYNQRDRRNADLNGLRGTGLAGASYELQADSFGAHRAVEEANYANNAYDQSDNDGQGDFPAHLSDEFGSSVRILADRVLNAVLIRDRASAMAQHAATIAQLDRSPELVEIVVTIIDVDKNRLKEVGFQWGYSNRNASLRLGRQRQEPTSAGGLVFNTVLRDVGGFLASIQALQAEGGARIVSRPQVVTMNNTQAVLSADESFFVRVAGAGDVDLFDVTVGTSLRVTPVVSGHHDQKQIRMAIRIEDGKISARDQIDDVPVVERRALNTQAIVYDGQSLLLGGLVREANGTQTSKVPLLGDVPVLGKLFQSKRRSHARTERLFLVTPRRVIASEAPAPQSRQPEPSRQLSQRRQPAQTKNRRIENAADRPRLALP